MRIYEWCNAQICCHCFTLGWKPLKLTSALLIVIHRNIWRSWDSAEAFQMLFLPKIYIKKVTAKHQRKHQITLIVNYTFIVPCPANERFQFHPSQVLFKSSEVLNFSKRPNMPPLPPVMLITSQPSCARDCRTFFWTFSEWDSFSQSNMFCLKLLSPCDDWLNEA